MNLNFLIIEDTKSDHENLSLALNQQVEQKQKEIQNPINFHIKIAESVTTAKKILLSEFKPDIIFLDQNLQEEPMGGVQIAEFIRDNDIKNKLVVAYSSNLDNDMTTTLTIILDKVGCKVFHVPKPIGQGHHIQQIFDFYYNNIVCNFRYRCESGLGDITLNFSDIIKIENYQHTTILSTEEKDYTIPGNIGSHIKKFPRHIFARLIDGIYFNKDKVIAFEPAELNTRRNIILNSTRIRKHNTAIKAANDLREELLNRGVRARWIVD